jgi:hypothetical protein
VKEVVTSLAINPNTVLKAYKELEHLGLAPRGRASASSSRRRSATTRSRPTAPSDRACNIGWRRRGGPGSARRASRHSFVTSFARPFQKA